jgi:four helix bundle protein
MKKPYRDLFIWQASVDLAVDVVGLARGFPQGQRFVLGDQMQRAAISVPSNIAEGKGRLSPREFRHFLGTARGSLYELDTHVEIAVRSGFLNLELRSGFDERIAKISTGINHLIGRL